jgi:hypothetical protein
METHVPFPVMVLKLFPPKSQRFLNALKALANH